MNHLVPLKSKPKTAKFIVGTASFCESHLSLGTSAVSTSSIIHNSSISPGNNSGIVHADYRNSSLSDDSNETRGTSSVDVPIARTKDI